VDRFEGFYDVNNSEGSVSGFKTSDSAYKSEESAKLLFKYCNTVSENFPENITLNSLKYAINTYTEKYVKMAIDKSMEAGKFNMAYINGILKNWKREGYPNEDSKGESINGTNSYGKGNIQDTGKFEGFKPKEPRKLTEEERKSAEKNLI
ncbi:DnaD domain protein, partial [Clostridium neonatale]